MSEPVVTFYKGKDCHLCGEALERVERVRCRFHFRLEIIDITSEPGLRSKYGSEIPVVILNGRKIFKYRVSEEKLLKLLEMEKQR